MLAERELVEVVPQRGTLVLEVSSVVVRLALLHVAEQAGWQRCGHEDRCRCVVVTDRPPTGYARHVLVVRDVPADCQAGLDAVMEGRACSVVLWDEPETLATVFEALEHESVLVPRRVVELASSAPRLTPRQRSTLRLVSIGRSNDGIAAALHQSISTAKRDIAELFELFDAPNRAALICSASALGFV